MPDTSLHTVTLHYPGGDSEEIQVTNSSKFVNNLMGDSYILLDFYASNSTIIPAFTYLSYGTTGYFFCKEDYRPTRDGTGFHYEVKLVSLLHILSKIIFFRYITLSDGTKWTEADFSVNCDIKTMLDLWLTSAKENASQFATVCPVLMQLLNDLTINVTKEDETLNTYTFSGVDMYSALSTIVNANSDNQQEFWISHEMKEDHLIPTINIGRCEEGETIILKDEDGGNQIYSIEYANEWQNVTNTIIPFGAERNMTAQTITEAATGLVVSYGKRIRLDANTTYTVKAEDGTDVEITTNAKGGFDINGVTSKIEEVKNFEDIYPKCHYQVTEVYRSDSDIYTITLRAMNETEQRLYTNKEMYEMGLCPYTNTMVMDGETLKVVFESGALSGQEFEVSNDPCQVAQSGYVGALVTVAICKLQIKPNTIGDQQIPIGNFIPKGSTVYGEGDQVALFNMKMPEGFIANARQELAQAAYDYLVEVEKTRPEINVQGYVNYFQNLDIKLGARVSITSPLFGTQDEPGTIVSRVTKLEHDLFYVSDYDLVISSSQVVGILSTFESAIADVTEDVRGVEQRTVAVSRRAYRDAQEMSKMLNSLQSEMLLVGNEKTQFACSCSFTPNYEGNYNAIHISYGALQHTQEPYISYTNKGTWEGGNVTLTQAFIIDDETGKEKTEAVDLEDDTPYYLYAQVTDATESNPKGTITFDLHEMAQDSEDHLLVGILSSVFEGKRTFNRTNGYSAITGGTITTEVIQDASKKLVIDFPNATITARNGGKIRGVIEVTSGDDDTPVSELTSIDIGTIDEDYINQVTDDLYYCSGQIDTIDKGNEYLASFWDVTHTDVQDTDYRFAGNNLLHEFYMLPESEAVDFVGKTFIATFKMVRRLCYSGVHWWEGRETYDESGTETFEQEYMYFFIKWKSATAGTSGIKKFYFEDDSVPSKQYQFEYAYTSDIPSDAQVFCGFRIYTELAKFHPSAGAGQYFHWGFVGNMWMRVNGLSNSGGLISTMFLLRDMGGNIIGGMSGLADHISMWEGGTYSDAYKHTSSLPFYISKDPNGTGSKIGPLTVEDPKTIAVHTSSWNTIRITDRSIDDFLQDLQTFSRKAGDIYAREMNNTHSGEYLSISESQVCPFNLPVPGRWYNTTDLGFEVVVKVFLKKNGISERFLIHLEDFVVTNTLGQRVNVNVTGTTSAGGLTDWYKVEKDGIGGSVEGTEFVLFTYTTSSTQRINPYSLYWQIEAFGNSRYYAMGDYRSKVWATLYIRTRGVTGVQSDVESEQIVIGRDGIGIQNGAGVQFILKNENEQLNLVMTGLPTKTGSLKTGQIYIDNDYLKVASTASLSSSTKTAGNTSDEEEIEVTKATSTVTQKTSSSTNSKITVE